ncbi:MAG: hypothetical protein ACK5Q2_07075, partial [Bacteroidota bacterium]
MLKINNLLPILIAGIFICSCTEERSAPEAKPGSEKKGGTAAVADEAPESAQTREKQVEPAKPAL